MSSQLINFGYHETAATAIYTLSLHDALPISDRLGFATPRRQRGAPYRRHHGGAETRHHSAADGGRADLYAALRHLRPEDRKSTRLNSSHLVISYAVFCLKKETLDRSICSKYK